MTYNEIKETVTKFDYEFPIIADDGAGNQIVINEGVENIFLDDEDVECHYYKVFLYLPEGVKITKYFEIGIVVDVRPESES